MRDIKFRAWDEYKGEMFIILHIDKEGNPISYRKAYHGILWEGSVWMQYTGLKDKNGKEIYDGDIFRPGSNFSNRDPGLHVVKWEDKSCGFEPFSDSMANCGCCGSSLTAERGEVIGNIHENPELIA